jgi:hypothetical protein
MAEMQMEPFESRALHWNVPSGAAAGARVAAPVARVGAQAEGGFRCRPVFHFDDSNYRTALILVKVVENSPGIRSVAPALELLICRAFHV